MSLDTMTARRLSHEEIEPKVEIRKEVILRILGREEMTASEITERLLQQGYIKYYDRNFVSPRLTELAKAGKVVTTGRRECHRTGKSVSIWMRTELP